jgi:hypothetical protein
VVRSNERKWFLVGTLIAAGVLCVCISAYSQTSGQTWDTSQLPATNGRVKQYTLTPRGDVDGLILTDGTEVKIPPHLSAQVVYAIHPGDAVMIRGLRALYLPLVQAEAVTNTGNNQTVVDTGPPSRVGTRPEVTTTGKVTATLHGARGEVNGALLDGGLMLRLPPREAELMQALLAPGQMVAARGSRLDTALGTVMEVRALGTSADRLTELPDVPPPPPPPKPR